MSTDPTTLDGFVGTARLFPLPNLVFFPGVVQGLHVFEPRYRQLMADTLAADQLFALVLLSPGWEEDYDGRPAIESVACLGRVVWHERLIDGRYNLRLRGLSRIRILQEIDTDRLYRTARVDLIADRAPVDPDASKGLRRDLAAAVLARFADDGPAGRQLRELFDGEMTLGQVCDVLAYALPLPAELKQALLAEPRADHRAVTLASALRADPGAGDRRFPPPFSPN
jgi:Lon protease-like protein